MPQPPIHKTLRSFLRTLKIYDLSLHLLDLYSPRPEMKAWMKRAWRCPGARTRGGSRNPCGESSARWGAFTGWPGLSVCTVCQLSLDLHHKTFIYGYRGVHFSLRIFYTVGQNLGWPCPPASPPPFPCTPWRFSEFGITGCPDALPAAVSGGQSPSATS